MFKRLVLTLMFKAVLALGTMLGLASFAVYLSGGSPGAIWSKVGGGALASMGDSASRLGSQVAGFADSARHATDQTLSAVTGGDSDTATGASTQLWTWQDEAGVTHYSNTAPPNAGATTMFVNPNANVVAPVSAPPAPRRPSDRSRATTTPQDASGGAGAAGTTSEPLPGIAGALQQMPGASQAVDPDQARAVLQLLQGAAPN